MVPLTRKCRLVEKLFFISVSAAYSRGIISPDDGINTALTPLNQLQSLKNDLFKYETMPYDNLHSVQEEHSRTVHSALPVDLPVPPIRRYRNDKIQAQQSAQSSWITKRIQLEIFDSESNYYTRFFQSMATTSPTESAPLETSSEPTPTVSVFPSVVPTIADPDFEGNSATNMPSFDDSETDDKQLDDKAGSDEENNHDDCSTSNGAYGFMQGAPFIATFLYGVKTIENVTETTLINDILPPIETAFNDYLMPLLFPSTCASNTAQATERIGGKQNRERKLLRNSDNKIRASMQHHRRNQEGTLIGISARPSDYFDGNLKCVQNMNKTMPCFVIDGKISLFFGSETRRLSQIRSLQFSTNGSATFSEYEAMIRSNLKTAMDNGTFDHGNPDAPDERVQRVYYIDGDDSGTSIAKGDDNTSSSPKNGGVSSTLVGTFVAVGGALLVVASVILYRRRQGNEVVGEDADNFDGDSTTMMPDGASKGGHGA